MQKIRGLNSQSVRSIVILLHILVLKSISFPKQKKGLGKLPRPLKLLWRRFPDLNRRITAFQAVL